MSGLNWRLENVPRMRRRSIDGGKTWQDNGMFDEWWVVAANGTRHLALSPTLVELWQHYTALESRNEALERALRKARTAIFHDKKGDTNSECYEDCAACIIDAALADPAAPASKPDIDGLHGKLAVMMKRWIDLDSQYPNGRARADAILDILRKEGLLP